MKFPWYDSQWLQAYVNTKNYLKDKQPEILEKFESDMKIFKTPKSFEAKKITHIPFPKKNLKK